MSYGGQAALRRHQGIDGERRGVVRIIRIAACYAHGPVDARMPSDERNCTIDGAGGGGQCGIGNAQQRTEYTKGVNDWPERSSPYVALWKPPSAACCAQRYCAARASELRSRFHEHAARPPPSTRRRGGQRARSTVRFRIAALVIATLPVMQW